MNSENQTLQPPGQEKCSTHPILYKMDKKPDWKVFLNIALELAHK
jgi:hypothetical protein